MKVGLLSCLSHAVRNNKPKNMVPNSGLSKGLEKKYVALNLDSLKVAFETRLLG